MNYVKGWFVNFLIIFFANHILPGIVVKGPAKLPHIGGEIPFAIFLAILNSLIYPIMKMVDKSMVLAKLILVVVIVNFSAYALLKFMPIDLHVESIEGYLLASVTVTVGSILAHLREMKKKSLSVHETHTHKSEHTPE